MTQLLSLYLAQHPAHAFDFRLSAKSAALEESLMNCTHHTAVSPLKTVCVCVCVCGVWCVCVCVCVCV